MSSEVPDQGDEHYYVTDVKVHLDENLQPSNDIVQVVGYTQGKNVEIAGKCVVYLTKETIAEELIPEFPEYTEYHPVGDYYLFKRPDRDLWDSSPGRDIFVWSPGLDGDQETIHAYAIENWPLEEIIKEWEHVERWACPYCGEETGEPKKYCNMCGHEVDF